MDPSALNGKVVVYYGRMSCQYCLRVLPLLHELNREYPDVKFLYYDTAVHPFEGGVPHFEFFNRNMKVSEVTGADDNSIIKYTDMLSKL